MFRCAAVIISLVLLVYFLFQPLCSFNQGWGFSCESERQCCKSDMVLFPQKNYVVLLREYYDSSTRRGAVVRTHLGARQKWIYKYKSGSKTLRDLEYSYLIDGGHNTVLNCLL